MMCRAAGKRITPLSTTLSLARDAVDECAAPGDGGLGARRTRRQGCGRHQQSESGHETAQCCAWRTESQRIEFRMEAREDLDDAEETQALRWRDKARRSRGCADGPVSVWDSHQARGGQQEDGDGARRGDWGD